LAEEDIKPIVRIADVDLDGHKKVPYALTGIKGIGIRMAYAICRELGIDEDRLLGELSDEEIQRIEEEIERLSKGESNIPSWMYNRQKDYETGEDKHLVGAELEMTVKQDIDRLKKIRAYRGVRHELGLPVRGQRTKSSFRRGKTVGVKKKQR
jgi:small subunit ribosomal protein S13